MPVLHIHLNASTPAACTRVAKILLSILQEQPEVQETVPPQPQPLFQIPRATADASTQTDSYNAASIPPLQNAVTGQQAAATSGTAPASSTTEEDENPYCSICRDNGADSKLPCGHKFHRACIRPWVVAHFSCGEAYCGEYTELRDIISL